MTSNGHPSAYKVLLAGAFAGLSMAVASGYGLAETNHAKGQPVHRPPRPESHGLPAHVAAQLDPSQTHEESGRLVQHLADGSRVQLTVHPRLQQFARELLAAYEVPFGAVVAIEPDTGRVLAYVSHSSENAGAGDLVREASPPAASLFKIVTGAALVDAGIRPDTRVCYSGGSHRVHESDLLDVAARDRSCASLAEAMGGSINLVFAKLADRTLRPERLSKYASAFGFGEPLPFDLPTRPSAAQIPSERLEFARTAAGFWHTHLSPLHAALLAATVANRGRMAEPQLVESVRDRSGKTTYQRVSRTFRTVISESTSRAVGEMMLRTVTHGTSRNAFVDSHGRPYLEHIPVAGKTGTLNGTQPFRAYSWWVGFAPADHPKVALSALVVNGPDWRIKSSFVAREVLRAHLAPKKLTVAKND